MSTIQLTHSTLLQACRPGGSSVLTSRTELAAAAGEHAGIAPARFVRGRESTYAFETRLASLADGEPVRPVNAVVIDSKGSSLNRIEQELSAAIRDGHPLLSRVPRIEVRYADTEPATCLDLPHRAFDGHIRAGHKDGKPVTEHPAYRAMRDCTAVNARALLEASPISIVLGSWDSTRRSHQVRFRSALVGETIGILSDQSASGTHVPPRGAARSDSIAPSVRLGKAEMTELLKQQRDELSPGNVQSVEKAIAKAKTGTTSAAALVLGSIPPSLEGLGFVSCQRIIRSHVLSFSALRQLRFGLGPDGDAAARALLAALALNGLARSYNELYYRANCDLVEAAAPVTELDARYGQKHLVEPLSIEASDQLLEEALEAATAAGIHWDGQVFIVEGNPLVAGGIIADADDEAAGS